MGKFKTGTRNSRVITDTFLEKIQYKIDNNIDLSIQEEATLKYDTEKYWEYRRIIDVRYDAIKQAMIVENKNSKIHKSKKQKKEIVEKEIKPKRIVRTKLESRYKGYIENAIRRNLVFEISFEYFGLLTNSNCFYCGGEGYGVDRINSAIGYIDGNVRPCCGKCNLMKYTHSTDVFMKHIKKIHDHLNL